MDSGMYFCFVFLEALGTVFLVLAALKTVLAALKTDFKTGGFLVM